MGRNGVASLAGVVSWLRGGFWRLSVDLAVIEMCCRLWLLMMVWYDMTFMMVWVTSEHDEV